MTNGNVLFEELRALKRIEKGVRCFGLSQIQYPFLLEISKK